MTIDQVEAKPTNIHDALSRAKIRIGVIGKDDENEHHHYQFRGIDAIVNRVGPVFAELGIVVSPRHKLISSDAVTSSSSAKGYRVIIETEWTFSIHSDEPGEYIEAQTLGESIDYSDKAINQAQTQSFKNALAQVLTIPTGETDPDSVSPDTVRELKPGEKILEVLIQTMNVNDARKYTGEAMKALGLVNPFPDERIDDVIVHAQELYDDAKANEEQPGEGYAT